MKTVAVMSALEDAQRRNMPSFEVPIHGTTLPFALMEVLQPEFDECASENAHQVLVRMEAFSCNYRDAGILFTSYGALCSLEKPGFMHFGSDFVGIVETVGSEVTAVKPGQRVMPDSSYPQDREPVAGDGIPTNKAGRGGWYSPNLSYVRCLTILTLSRPQHSASTLKRRRVCFAVPVLKQDLGSSSQRESPTPACALPVWRQR